jgi:solute carrier family 36 (proton-coupled amino acid transporter)
MWPNAIGFAVFAFEGVGIVLPVQDMTADKDRYFKVVCFTVCSIAALYIGFSELCLYAWYGRFNPNMPLITEYLPRDNFFCQCVILLFNVNMLITYALMIYPANKVLDSWFLSEMESGPKKRAYKNL